MFNNIGKKIKGLAKTIFTIETVLAILGGLICCSLYESLILVGLLIMVVVPLLAWIGSLLLYGFGELIDKTCDIERNTRGSAQEP